MRFPKPSLIPALALSVAGLGQAAIAQTTMPPFTTTIAADHPLSGQIFDVPSGKPVSPDVLSGAMAKSQYIFLGEKHDNPDHHAIQAWAYEALLSAGRRPALLYEMIGEDQQTDIDDFRQTGQDMEKLGEALDWENSGWPEWSLYAPLAISADKFGLPVFGANLPKSLTRKIYSDGVNVLGPGRAERLGLDKPPPDPIAKAILDDVDAGHCGLMPRDALGPMVTVQLVRDGVMADNVLRAGKSGDGAVLITGNGHARSDYGVPWVLSGLAPDITTLSFALIEVQDGQNSLEDYTEDFGLSLPFDFVLFTPRANDRDYCAELKASMGKKEN